jgi:tRNA-guanine family transglycosylase
MKVYLSWSPVPPDPPFWKWIELDGIVVSVALLKQKRLLERATMVGLHELLEFRGQIFLDSGSYEDFIADKRLRPKSPIELLVLAKWLGAELVAHLDIPFVGKNAKLPEEEKWALLNQNILNAKVSYEWSKRSKSRTKVVYVIQGWNQESLAYCCEKLAKLNAGYYAIGSLLGLQPNEIESRVQLVRKIIGNDPKLHLFAVSSLTVMRKVKSLVDSIDSSTASIAGAMKEIIKPSGGRSHINHGGWSLKCSCPICHEHKGAILLLGKSGAQNYYNQLRKIHNAYQLLFNLREALNNKSHKH